MAALVLTLELLQANEGVHGSQQFPCGMDQPLTGIGLETVHTIGLCLAGQDQPPTPVPSQQPSPWWILHSAVAEAAGPPGSVIGKCM